jgi:hypothetical protein
MMTLGTALCFVIAIGARSVLLEPSVSKTCLALAAMLGAWLLITRKSRQANRIRAAFASTLREPLQESVCRMYAADFLRRQIFCVRATRRCRWYAL